MERENNESSIRTALIQPSEEHAIAYNKDVRIVDDDEQRNKVVEEIKKQLWLAGPLVCLNVLLFCIQMISLMFVGHLGELSLSGASMGNSFSTVTGFSLLVGMASALDTFCGQSYGARQYRLLGVLMQRAMYVLTVVSIPLAIIWANTQPILTLVGQDPEYQSKLESTLAITTLLHLPLCWILIFKANLGVRGAAMANSLSYWINVLLLALYIKFSPLCAKSWTGFSKEAFHSVWNFIKLAVPSAIMCCLEMWSFEMMVLLSGLLPNPKLETSVLSVCLNTAATVWMIPFGLSGAVSTRVSNELGAGRPEAAILAVRVVLGIAIAEGIIIALVLILIRNIWGYAYSSETEVVKYVATMMPILAASNFLDGLQCVLSGTCRGCGWQKIGAFVNLGAYYLVGIPSGVLLAFVIHVGGKGLWLGICCALIVQVLSLLAITIRTNWTLEAKKASERVHESEIPTNVVC